MFSNILLIVIFPASVAALAMAGEIGHRLGLRTLATRGPVSMSHRQIQSTVFDWELAELPEGLRWRERMGRVEAAIFASPTPVPRETLALLVGDDCKLDDLIADIVAELRAPL